MAICKFRRDIAKDMAAASTDLYAYATHDQGLEKVILDELADLLSNHNLHAAAEIYEQIGRRFNDKHYFGKAARLRYSLGEHANAVSLFVEAGETNTKEYYLSLAETLLLERDYARAILLFHANSAYQRVVDSYEAGLESKVIGIDVKLVAEAYVALGRTDEASLIYEALVKDFVNRSMWKEGIECVSAGVFNSNQRIEMTCNILSAVAGSGKGLTQEERESLLEEARFVVTDPYWDLRMEPKTMGVIFTRCAGPRETADFHLRYTNEEWGRTGYLSALSALATLYLQNGDSLRSKSIESEIALRKKEWGLA